MSKRRNGFWNRPSEALSIAKRRDTAKNRREFRGEKTGQKLDMTWMMTAKFL